jgi:succinoglycan biosynthesis protein ExoV
MKLTYWHDQLPNFGDELNTYLWPQLLPPGFLDDDEADLFLGIGSIIWDFLPPDAHKFIIGSGYGGYTSPPNVHDGTWTPIFLRGARTADALGLSRDLAICDSAVLIRLLPRPRKTVQGGVGFMPHYDSLGRGYWRKVCQRAGLAFIDPTAEPDVTLGQIAGLDMLITEAMHGAIVADALRTPWLAARPTHSMHHAKWLDWSEALGIDLRWHDLMPSSVYELYIGLTRGRRFYEGRARRWGQHPLMRPVDRMLTERAAQHLIRLASEEPQLSADTNLERVTERAEQALDNFVRSRMKLGASQQKVHP